MAKIGHGYGSEFHLLRFMGRHRMKLDKTILSAIRSEGKIVWLDFGFAGNQDNPDSELQGLDFLSGTHYSSALNKWKDWWPATGMQPNWDAVGWAHLHHGHELLLVEAKAHVDELSSSSKAGADSLEKIERAFSEVKEDIYARPSADWTTNYYQMANRLAVLWFLRNQGVPARLIVLYFTGDWHPSGNCPKNEGEWCSALTAQKHYLGLSHGHSLEQFIDPVFISVT